MSGVSGVYQSGDSGLLMSFQVPKAVLGMSTRARKTVVVLDRSGSMSGKPWSQIQEAIRNILLRNLKVDAVTYNHRAMVVAPEDVATLLPDGGTDFATAYECLRAYLGTNVDHAVDIVFMTDGQDYSHNIEPLARQALRGVIGGRRLPCVVHCIGLGHSHDANLLQELSAIGTTKGIYRYVSAPTGSREGESDGLSAAMEEITGWANSVQRVEVSVCDGPFMPLELNFDSESDQYRGHFWCNALPASATPEGIQEAVIRVRGVNLLRVPLSRQARNWQYDILALRAELSRVSTLKELDALQHRLNTIRQEPVRRATRPTGPQGRIPRSEIRPSFFERKQIISERMEQVEEVQNLLDKFRQTMVDVARSNTRDSSVRAMFHSLQTEAVFQGSGARRRQREMERRVAGSSQMLETISASLQSLLDRTGQLADDERATLEQHVCVISQMNAYDLLTETAGDVMGFAVTVRRQNFSAVDVPALVVVENLSTTELSLEAFMNLVDFHKQRHGVERTLGTLSGSEEESQGLVIVGTSRETFNAFLPKYVSEAHMERVLLLLPVICGQFFTLTPEGYDRKQLEGLYSVLAQIGALAHSDLQRQMVEQFGRILLALWTKFPTMHSHFASSPELLSRLHNLPERFVVDPQVREKSNLATLNILYGVVRVMALGRDCSYDSMLNQLRLPGVLEAEVIRRVAVSTPTDQASIANLKSVTRILFADAGHVGSVSGMAEVDCGPDAAWIAWLESDFKGPVPDIQEASVMPYEPRKRRTDSNLGTAREMYALFTGRECPPVVHLSPEGQEAAILLALFAPTNAGYRSLVEAGCALTNPESAADREALYQHICRVLEKPREEVWQASVRAFQTESLVVHLANTVTDVRVFAAILHKVAPTRGGTLWPMLVDACLCDSAPMTVPQLPAKLHVMVTGLLQGRAVLGDEESTGWHAGPVYAARVRELCAARDPTLLADLERIMQDLVVRHVYRLSNIPNRHGHSNLQPNLKLVRAWDEI